MKIGIWRKDSGYLSGKVSAAELRQLLESLEPGADGFWVNLYDNQPVKTEKHPLFNIQFKPKQPMNGGGQGPTPQDSYDRTKPMAEQGGDDVPF